MVKAPDFLPPSPKIDAPAAQRFTLGELVYDLAADSHNPEAQQAIYDLLALRPHDRIKKSDKTHGHS